MDHRLKSVKQIDRLFKEGKSDFVFPVRMVWNVYPSEDQATFKYGVSVSKRHFKRAVDRNRIKRQMREACRQWLFSERKWQQGTTEMMFIYVGKELPEYTWLKSSLKRLIKKIL